ncbi:MAG: DUF6850 family outer membrane beta-barrel protein [Mangrovibacterium sp.]
MKNRHKYQDTRQDPGRFAGTGCKGATEYDWKLGAELSYLKREDEYILPFSWKDSENIALRIRVKRNFTLRGNTLTRRILAGADYTYSDNLSGSYQYNGSHADYPVVTKLEQTDAEYMNAGYYSLAGSVIYSQKLKTDMSANFFVKAEFRYTKSRDHTFDSRQQFKLSVGCNF